ncbi:MULTISPECIES: oligosaccharide repeat unit polymerase [Providencia]|nr:oligosaccharide repeat unit polymerase [Providencia rettgeri]PYZ60598.1 hypothetical protein DNK63_16415 [Providencia rettgeri]
MNFIHKKDNLLRYYLFLLYTLSNLLCSIYFIYVGKLGGDFLYRYPSEPYLIIISFLFYFIVFYCILFVFFPSIEKIKIHTFPLKKGVSLDTIFLFILIISIQSAIIYKIGVSGFKNEENYSFIGKLLFYFQSLFQPVYLCLIYLYYNINRNKISIIFKLNVFLFIILSIFTAQTALLMVVFIFIMSIFIKKNININKKKLFIYTIIGLLIYPFIRLFKYALVKNSHTNEDLSQLVAVFTENQDIWKSYIDFLFIGLERFQIVSNIQYIISNQESLFYQYQKLNPSYDFLGGYWFFDTILKYLNISSNATSSPQFLLALNINGADNWSSHISFLGYYFFYDIQAVFVYFPMLIIAMLAIFITKKIENKKEFINLTWLMFLLLICHGWFIQFVNYTQSLLVFLLIIFVLNIINISKNSKE